MRMSVGECDGAVGNTCATSYLQSRRNRMSDNTLARSGDTPHGVAGSRAGAARGTNAAARAGATFREGRRMGIHARRLVAGALGALGVSTLAPVGAAAQRQIEEIRTV